MAAESTIMLSLLYKVLAFLGSCLLAIFGYIVREQNMLRKRVTVLEAQQLTRSDVETLIKESIAPVDDACSRIEKALFKMHKSIAKIETDHAVLKDRSDRENKIS